MKIKAKYLTFIFTFLLLNISTTSLQNTNKSPLKLSAKNPINFKTSDDDNQHDPVLPPHTGPEEGSNFTTDVPYNQDIEGVKYFINYTSYKYKTPLLGRFINASDNQYIRSHSYLYSPKEIYVSGYFLHDRKSENFNTMITYSYSFEKYLDMPIKEFNTYAIYPNDKLDLTIQFKQGYSESNSSIIEKGYSKKDSFSLTGLFKNSIGLSLNDIGINNSEQKSFKISSEKTEYEKITNAFNSTNYYERVLSEKITLDNLKGNQTLYFKECYRQKFKVYFFASYEILYSKQETRCGLFNKDTKISYRFDSYKGIKTYFCLIPIESPYYAFTKYVDDHLGNKEYFGPLHEKIAYL